VVLKGSSKSLTDDVEFNFRQPDEADQDLAAAPGSKNTPLLAATEPGMDQEETATAALAAPSANGAAATNAESGRSIESADLRTTNGGKELATPQERDQARTAKSLQQEQLARERNRSSEPIHDSPEMLSQDKEVADLVEGKKVPNHRGKQKEGRNETEVDSEGRDGSSPSTTGDEKSSLGEGGSQVAKARNELKGRQDDDDHMDVDERVESACGTTPSKSCKLIGTEGQSEDAKESSENENEGFPDRDMHVEAAASAGTKEAAGDASFSKPDEHRPDSTADKTFEQLSSAQKDAPVHAKQASSQRRSSRKRRSSNGTDAITSSTLGASRSAGKRARRTPLKGVEEEGTVPSGGNSVRVLVTSLELNSKQKNVRMMHVAFAFVCWYCSLSATDLLRLFPVLE